MMESVENILQKLGFSPAKFVVNGASIHSLLGESLCGIYVLHFANGDYYVGQAVDAARRYTQHRKNYPDIERLSFRQVSQNAFNQIELETVKALEDAGFHLRNINLVAFSYTETGFSNLMTIESQKAWLENSAVNTPGTRTLEAPDFRQKYHLSYKRFRQKSFSSQVINVLRAYVQTCIPLYLATEVNFWIVSCNEVESRIRLNVGWQTAVEIVWNDERATYTFFLPGTAALKVKRAVSPVNWLKRGGDLQVAQSPLKMGGVDQAMLTTTRSKLAMQCLSYEDFTAGARQFNIALMQKGRVPGARFHCYDLADDLLLS